MRLRVLLAGLAAAVPLVAGCAPGAQTGTVGPAAASDPKADRRVAPGGADRGDCSARPCATLAYAYRRSAAGDLIALAAGDHGAQELPAGDVPVTVRGERGATLQALDNRADGATFERVTIDGRFARASAFENHGAEGVTFRDGRIGNVTDDMGAIVSGARFTFDDVVFHDVVVTDPEVHNECVYAIGVPAMTVRDSHFRDCATMDLFFTYGSWWSPRPPAYGDVTVENNVFEHTTTAEPGAWHHYGLAIGDTGSASLSGWVVRHNTFETGASVAAAGARNSRWVGNLGSWNCVPGMAYRGNVGAACGAADRALSPDRSTQAATAPFGWADPARHDFSLRPGSPAVGAGDPRDAPRRDRTGRPRDAAPDAGAFELAR